MIKMNCPYFIIQMPKDSSRECWLEIHGNGKIIMLDEHSVNSLKMMLDTQWTQEKYNNRL